VGTRQTITARIFIQYMVVEAQAATKQKGCRDTRTGDLYLYGDPRGRTKGVFPPVDVVKGPLALGYHLSRFSWRFFVHLS